MEPSTSRTRYQTYTACGPVANVAARLCALASGGSILVSADVAAHLADASHALEPLGPQQLKNVNQPVAAFRLSEKGRVAAKALSALG